VSVEAITWALSVDAPSSTSKFILVALANCARAEDGRAWPSIGYLCQCTQQDRKTVIANLDRLVAAGLISDVGRTGKTKQIRVFELGEKRNSSESGIVPDLPHNGTAFPRKESRFSPERVPEPVHGTVSEPIKEPSGKPKKAPKPVVGVEVLIAAGFDARTAAEFIATKVERKAPLTERAWADHCAEAAKAGWTPQQAAEKVMAKTWKGFEAKYVVSERPLMPGAQPAPSSSWEDSVSGVSARGEALGIGTWHDVSQQSLLQGRVPTYEVYRRRVLEAHKAAAA
jgi:hypothetical protein